MPAVIEVRSHTIAPAELEALSQFAVGLDEGQLRDLLLALSDSLSSGFDLTLLDSSTELTPQQAADQLRMSHTHLYNCSTPARSPHTVLVVTAASRVLIS
jgi:hypothetical protein